MFTPGQPLKPGEKYEGGCMFELRPANDRINSDPS